MKALTLLQALAFLTVAAVSHAQSDTAHHREVYNAINNKEASLKKVTAIHNDEPTIFALTGWLEGGEVRKIVAKCGDDGGGVEEYYLENEQPLFVYSTYNRGSEGSKGVKVEERLYFKNGEVFKWLTTEKPAPVFHSEDYAGTTERLTTNCTAFVAALKKGQAGTKKAAAAKVIEGTFTGIEEGDYAHWNMRSKAGDDVSLFILNPGASMDKVLENPQAYIGRKCRVTWKKTTENIPEAGGKMEVEQIVSVEWLGKK